MSTLELLPISFLVLLQFLHSTFWDTCQDSALTECIYLINSSFWNQILSHLTAFRDLAEFSQGVTAVLYCMVPKPVNSKSKNLAEESIHSRDGYCTLNSRTWQSYSKLFLWCGGIWLWTIMPLRIANDEECTSTEKKRHHLQPLFFPPWQTIQRTFSTLRQKILHQRK